MNSKKNRIRGMAMGSAIFLAGTILVFFLVIVGASEDEFETYLPVIADDETAVTPPVIPSPLPPPTAYVKTPPVDFTAVRAEAQEQGLELSFNKIGFHVGSGGNQTGLGEMMAELDAAGVPFVLKSADNAGAIYEAQQLMQASGVPHILIYRRASGIDSVPEYSLPPAEAARRHWAAHKAAFPPELDPSLVWLETMNEVDKERAAWMGEFAVEMAQLTMADGYKWAAFGWSGGTPEQEGWEEPSMLAFLELAAANPDKVAVALHEYSFVTEEITRWYPWLVGRFQILFDVCDRNGIERPTVLITEWGWAERDVPSVERAMDDIAWAAWMYAAYPQVKGAAIWYLGPGFGDIDNQTQQLIAPITAYSRSHYFFYDPGFGGVDPSLFYEVTPREERFSFEVDRRKP